MRFVLDKMALGQFLPQAILFFPVSALYSYFIHLPSMLISEIESVVK